MRRFFFIFLMILLAFIIAILPNPDHSNLQAAPLHGGPPEKYTLLALQHIKQIAAGKSHTCAVSEDGGVKCWGANSTGQFGDIRYPVKNSPAAVEVHSLSSGITAVAVGGAHTCALTDIGGVKCWGKNINGQLGNNSFGNSNSPVDVFGLGSGVIAIAAGELHTCALLQSGSVQCWGTTYDQQTRPRDFFDLSLIPEDVPGLQEPVIALAAEWYHTCALTSTGAVKCWGEGADGQLGNKQMGYSRVPVDVQGLGSGVIALAAGERHSCALTRVAGILCWGNNNNGQLGSEGIRYSSTPVKVQTEIDDAIALTAGGDHTCALTAEGAIQCWGANDSGQLGNNGPRRSPVPLAVTGLRNSAIAVSAGGSHTCAVTHAGDVACWGNSAEGRLGDDKIDTISRAVPVSGVEKAAVALVAGDYHTCALTNVGGVKCWGNNHYGQLGNNNLIGDASAAAVDRLRAGVITLAAGANHTCALTDGGAVLCWGSNAAGQLGDNSREDSTVPVAVSGLGDGIHTLVAGVNHTCVLTDGGAVLCWGDNEAGQLGDNSSEDSHIPVAVFGVSRGVSALVAGTNYTCALTDVGTLLCWGTNNLGPLPWQISSLANRSIPTPMNRSDLARKVTAIAAQGNLICALYDVGTVECWGQDNTNGLSATYENLQSIPIPLAWFKDGTEDPPTQAHDRKTAARGFAHTCSLTDVGSVVCWGANDTSQLGNGSTRKTTPVHVLAKIIIAPENDPQLLLPTPTPTLPIPTPTVAATVTTAAAVSLLPTITPTPRSSDLLPAPLYFLAPDQQIWQLTGSASNVISQTITHEPWPIVSFDFSPIHGRFVYITANQLVEFDPKTNTRIVKIKGPALPPTQADGRYTIEQIGTLVLGTPRYSPDGTQIAYTQAGVNLVRSGFEGTSTPQRLLRNVLWLESLMTPLASTVDWTTNVGEIRLYGGEMIWSPDGKKLLLGYTGWEWYGYEIYDQVTASLVSLPIGVNGEWQWRKDNGMGIVANSGYGGVFDSGLFLVDAQDAATHRLDLTSLNVTVEENPFTPLARAAYELPSGEIFFFMGTRFLRQDSSHSIFYALAEINPATNSLSWVQAEENRQEVELGEVLWSVDGSGVVNSRPSTPLQWLPVDGSPAIDLGIIGNNLRWGTTPTAETIIPVPTFTATPTAVPTLLPTPADLVTPPAPTFAPATPIPNLGHEATKGANQ